IERDIQTALNAAFTMAALDDRAGARAFLGEALKMPGAESEDVQRAAKLIEGIVAWRAGGGVDAVPPPKDENDMGGIFTVGLCNLDVGSADVAAQRFKQIVDWKRPSTSALYAVAPLYYGRALAKLGRTGESRKAYDAFFAAFKNADNTLPILAAAKKEYARL